MRLQEDLDFTTLNWVKQELDETLKQARQSLESFVEDPADASLMRFCATYLHQVQGTLRMVELYGAAMVVEEMERLANALLDNQIRQKDDAYSVLMRGIVQLPDYLERLQSGHKDIPIVLLPLLNDLRACRGEKLLSESVLFSPDLSAPLPRGAMGPDRPVPELELRQQAARLRTQFQMGLLHWIKDQNAGEAASSLMATLDKLRGMTVQDSARRLWWVAAGLMDAVRTNKVDTSTALKSLFGRVDREIKRLADSGEPAFRVDPPRELTKNLLYYVAHSTADSERVREIRDTYRLDQLLPSQHELEHAKGSLAGRNKALLDTVSAAIKDDLMRVKDVLDLHLRNAETRPDELGAQAEVLERVADTLGMLGLGVPRRVVQEQTQIIQQLATGVRKVDETTLLDIAGALLYVEASLDDNIENLGSSAAAPAESEAVVAQQASALELPQTEVKRILDALLKEAMTNLQTAKQDIVAFVESPWDHAKVTQIPRLLEEISGALRMLDLPEPGQLVDALVKFVAMELLRMKRVPTPEQMDRLADALASVEYYLEASRDQRSGREKILDVTRRSLEALGYWPIPAEALGIELDDVVGPPPTKALAAAAPAPVAPAPAAPVAAAPAAAVESASVDAGTGGVRFDTPVESGRALLTEPVDEPADAPRLELPVSGVEEAIARIDRGEEARYQAPAVDTPTAPAPELTSVVEIARGRDVSDLSIGETPSAPVEPPPPPHELAGLKLAETQPIRVWGDSDDDWETVDVEEEVEVDAPAGEAMADSSFQAVPSDDIDDEIREVFVEEVQEEIDNVNRNVPAWSADSGDLEKLKPIRRSFHTLKGSGRLVGAMALGEFSWKVENMLNRVLDKTIPAGPPVVALLNAALAALPELLSALRGEGSPKADIAQIMAVADQVAAGEQAFVQGPQKIKVKQIRQVRVLKAQPPEPVAAPAELTVPVSIEPPVTLEPVVPVELSTPMTPVPLPAVSDADADQVPTQALQPEPVAEPEITIPSVDAEPEDVVELASVETEPMAVEPEVVLESVPDTAEPVAELPVVESEPVAEPEPAAAVAEESADVETGPIVPALDAMLLEILRSEVEGHVGVVRAYLASCTAHGSTLPATEELLRAVHTMHGALSMAEVPVLNDIVGPLEGYLKRLRGRSAAPSAEGLSALRDSSDIIERALKLLDQPGRHLPSGDDLAARIEALRDDLPEPSSALKAFALQVDEDDVPEVIEPITLESAAPAAELVPEEAAFIEAVAPIATVETVPSVELPASVDAPSIAAEEPAVAADAFDEIALFSDAVPSAPELATGADDALPAIEAIEIEGEPALTADVDDLAFADLPLLAEEPAVVTASVETDTASSLPSWDLAALEALAGESFTVETPAEPTPAVDAAKAAEAPSAVEALFEPVAPAAEASTTEDDFASAFFSTDAAAPVADAASAAAVPTAAVEPPLPVDVAPAEAAALDDLMQVFETEVAPASTASAVDQTEDAVVPASAPAPQLAAAVTAPEPAPVARVAPAAPQVRAAPIDDDLDPPGPLYLPDMDEDLLGIFVEEGHDILDKSSALVAQLHEPAQADDAVAGLKRHLHTLKGNARAVGLVGIGDLSHAIESVFEGVSDERLSLDGGLIGNIERGFDRLHHLVERVAQRQAIGLPTNAIARFEALAEGQTFSEVATPAAPAPAPVVDEPIAAAQPLVDAAVAADTAPDAAPAPAPVAAEPPKPRPAAKPAEAPVEEDNTLGRAPQEMIRVRSDLLDTLVNFAGEVSIYRSRLEQQMGTFRFNLVELDQTVARLREQLRKLEIETEAQIIARFQREAAEAHAEFDPLELDQFSNVQQLSRALAESVADLVALQAALDDLTRQSETLLLQQSRVSSELQEGLMRTRMVPFDSIVPFLRRLVRQTSDLLGKRASLKVEGAQGEMDRNLLERMKAPFEHMLRNAIDHGIESVEQRRAAGKPDEGTVRIHVSRESTEVVIRVSDDGKGMNREAIRKKAIERGLMRADAQLSDRDLYGFVLETGFSTAEKLTQTSGRGVGMDVVASEIKQLGGSLAIDSKPGQGSTFMVRLPFTLAVTQAIMVRLADQVFAIPMSSVQGVARIPRDDLDRRMKQVNPLFTYAGEEYSIHDLPAMLGMSTAIQSEMGQLPLLLTRSGDQRAAIRVDAVIGSREVVVKTAGPQVNSVPGIFGATIMGDGSVVLILDFAPLVRRSAAKREETRVSAALEEAIPGFLVEREALEPLEPLLPAAPERKRPFVMVVDDSITMRKVTSRVLERNDMEVATAKDGLDAVEKLQERVPDLMLLDIEMPRMDGYELATYMRNDSRLRHVPIIMITSRTGEKHRQRALEIGVDRYLGKPYQEPELLKNVEEILGTHRGAQ